MIWRIIFSFCLIILIVGGLILTSQAHFSDPAAKVSSYSSVVSLPVVRGSQYPSPLQISSSPLNLSPSSNLSSAPFSLPHPIRPLHLPSFEAWGVIALDPVTDFVFYGKNTTTTFPIASITKLMTALVWADLEQDPQQVYHLQASDLVTEGRVYLRAGESIKVKDLLNLSLVASANTATRALVRSTGLGDSEFVEKMNQLAKRFKFKNTQFVDYIGLSRFNQSSPGEVARLLVAAFSHPLIQQALSRSSYRFLTVGGREIKAESTNLLWRELPDGGIKLKGGKTGYIQAARFCLAAYFEKDNHPLVTVILGAPTHFDRFTSTRQLAEWVFDNYQWSN